MTANSGGLNVFSMKTIIGEYSITNEAHVVKNIAAVRSRISHTKAYGQRVYATDSVRSCHIQLVANHDNRCGQPEA